MHKVLLFSSLCKPQVVLQPAIDSWIGLDHGNLHVDVLLYNDNNDGDAYNYVASLPSQVPAIKVESDWFNTPSDYKKHAWTGAAVDRIIHIKNKALSYAVTHGYDAVFLVDADLVLHPQTLVHLASLEKDFVFEIFWTVFTDMLFAKPNCWDVHSWGYHNAQSILKLKDPGTYEVGAGGACTLLTTKAIKAGVNFSKIGHLPYGGEDRHICTRAAVLGFPIFIDTHFPAFHIYTTQLAPEAQNWIAQGYQPTYFNDWLDATWQQRVHEAMQPEVKYVPKNKLDKVRMALYKARRAYINYMRYH